MSFLKNTPNGGLITETNQQYYVGTQINIVSYTGVAMDSMVYTFNEVLSIGSAASWSPNDYNYHLNNFIVEVSPDGLSPYTLWDGSGGAGSPAGPNGSGGGYSIQEFSNIKPYSTLSFANDDAITDGYWVKITLKSQLVDGAPNYGDYQYISIFELVNNFMIGYVGDEKLISKVKRSDVLFFAKRGLQEFSYDTLRSVQSQELTIPPSLSVIIPQDYVNYVGLSFVDNQGIKHPIYPTNLTSNPTEAPIQDTNITNTPFGFNFPSSGYGIPVQDNFGENLEGTSLTEERWGNIPPFNQPTVTPIFETGIGNSIQDTRTWGLLGQRYGLDPETAQGNGWFTINKREGKFSFSSNLGGRLILLEYISDGLAYDEDTKVPKMAEEALYMHIAYSILASKTNVPEYVVSRYKKERKAQLRNAKIRLSNIKPAEFVQVMRGKSKWIKY
jgi:hypothetical protein